MHGTQMTRELIPTRAVGGGGGVCPRETRMTENGAWGIKYPQLYASVSKQRQREPRSLGITSIELLAEDTGSSEMEEERARVLV